MFLHHLFCHSDIFYSIMRSERGDTSEMEEQIDYCHFTIIYFP